MTDADRLLIRDQQIAVLRQQVRNLALARDAWMETAHRALAEERSLREQLKSAPTHAPAAPQSAPFPARALIGGDGRFMG
jgi:hypothetical protein